MFVNNRHANDRLLSRCFVPLYYLHLLLMFLYKRNASGGVLRLHWCLFRMPAEAEGHGSVLSAPSMVVHGSTKGYPKRLAPGWAEDSIPPLSKCPAHQRRSAFSSTSSCLASAGRRAEPWLQDGCLPSRKGKLCSYVWDVIYRFIVRKSCMWTKPCFSSKEY